MKCVYARRESGLRIEIYELLAPGTIGHRVLAPTIHLPLGVYNQHSTLEILNQNHFYLLPTHFFPSTTSVTDLTSALPLFPQSRDTTMGKPSKASKPVATPARNLKKRQIPDNNDFDGKDQAVLDINSPANCGALDSTKSKKIGNF